MMVERSVTLPEFENPPVIEVALSVQFGDIPKLKSMQIGLLWQSGFHKNFPVSEEHPALENIQETFGLNPPHGGNFRFHLGPPPQRFLFLNKEGTELLQVQNNRFVHNWRKQGQDIDYPRYQSVKETFLDNLRHLDNFINEMEIGSFLPTQCEVTYVNEITAGEGWENHSELDKILTLCGSTRGEFLPQPENIEPVFHYIMIGPSGGPVGRLHLSISPRYRAADQSPVYVYQLVARGAPLGEGIDGVSNFLDLGHEWIVRGFADTTTDEMYRVWRRTQ